MSQRFFSPSPEKAFKSVCQKRLSQYLSDAAIKETTRAFYFAEKAHRGQSRHTGEHYIHHPIEVADTLAELQMDAPSVIAALLHDVIEDTAITKQDISDQFGAEVALLVDGVSKIGQIEFNNREEAEAENFRKMLMAMSQDVRVMIIKLADRLHNMRTLSVMRREKQKRISRQTLEIYAPIAERLGLYHWARELQDLCFLYLYPKRHDAITKALASREGNRKLVVQKLRNSLERSLQDSQIDNFKIVGRRKAVYSIYKKMVRKRRSFEELHDIYGFRIIVDTLDDCYRTLGVIHNAYNPIPGRFVDYIAIPKANGYQSLHTVVFGPLEDNIEVQIRTRDMDRIAETGVAAHWIYKTGSKEDVEKTSHLTRQWLLDLLDPSNETGNPIEFLDHLKADLYPDEVYVFTPKGDIKKMPRGATALDFAFAVHTDIGLHCTGARINRVLASLPTVLNNGDKVEIITAKNTRPTTAWLNYAVTARALSKIRHFLKNQTQDEALKLGKRLLAGSTKRRLFARRINKSTQAKLLDKLGLQTWSELLIDIGMGNRLPDIVARQLAQLDDDTQVQGKVLDDTALVIRGSEGLLVTYSRCCYPLPGDSILGTFTAGHGLVVHTTDCPNISDIRKQPERCLMVEWDDDLQGDFNAKLNVKLEHSRGAFADIASAIAENESNINNVDVVEQADGSRLVEFLIEVRDRIHLARIMKDIRRQPKALKVWRSKG